MAWSKEGNFGKPKPKSKRIYTDLDETNLSASLTGIIQTTEIETTITRGDAGANTRNAHSVYGRQHPWDTPEEVSTV